MSMTDNLVLAGVLIAAVFIFVWVIRRKKRGCGCCSSCGDEKQRK